MKTWITMLSLAAFAVAAPAVDDKDKAKPAAASPQQSKMKQCNADAKGKKGDERKAFMKECLSKKA